MIILLTGNDTYTLHSKLKEIRQKFLREVDPSNINSVTLTPEDLQGGTLRRELTASPFLAKRRLVILKGCGPTIMGDELLIKEWQEVCSMASDDAQDLPIAVLVESTTPPTRSSSRKKTLATPKRSPKKTSIVDTLPGTVVRIEAWIRSAEDIVQFAVEQAGVLGIRFDRSALAILAQLPPDPWAVGNLVATLAHGVERPSEPITADDIRRWSTVAVDDTMFGLQDAFANRNTPAYLKELAEKLDAGVHPLVVLATLERTIGLLWGALTDQLPPMTHPYVAQKIRTQSRAWNLDKIKTIARLLFLSDGLLKSSSGLGPETVLTRLAFTLST